jgi:hypothetical protein
MRNRRPPLFVLGLAWLAITSPPTWAEDSVPGWPALTDNQQKAALAALKLYAQATQTKLGLPMRAFETQYFLFCTDLPQGEAQRWAGLLDRMYGKLSQMFAVPEGKNIWRGKAMIFVFARNEDYQRYEMQMLHYDAKRTAGLCHNSPDGTVKIAFYRQRDELGFAHLLVHETVHGFQHRYRSPVGLPSWVSEGMADMIATDLMPQAGHRNEVLSRAREQLQSHRGDLGNFFTASPIEDWQYPVAEALCTMMIQASSKNYVDFVNGLKDGLTSEQSLREKYKAPKDRLVPVFEQWVGYSR